ncbi:MAG: gfo/Idh/MocA family oxidoreductase [Thermoprotei archaeon]|mgnify:CR=1 FL=1|nr:MAG: gfo/Idh/MocA family oxidoreductase [Thermoprotei archaeon]
MPLKIGFIGGGFVAKFHVRAWQGVRDSEITAVYSPSGRGARETAELAKQLDVGNPKVYTDLHEFLSDPNIDAVWVLSPNYTRVDVAKAIYEEVTQGRSKIKAVAFEKPLARNLSEAYKIVDYIEKAGLLHGYLENQVFSPSVVRGKELAWRRGAAISGRPYLARAAEEHGGPHSPWFWHPYYSGGGVLLDMGCHSVEAGRYMLYNPQKGKEDLKPIEVIGYTACLKWKRPEYIEKLKNMTNGFVDYSKLYAEDYARIIVNYETSDGLVVTSESSNAWSFIGPGLRLTFELFGPEYYVQINTLQPELYVFFSREVKGPAGEDLVEKQAAEQGLMPALPDETFTYGYTWENNQMVKAFLAGRNAPENLHDGVLVMELLMAAYKSAEEKRIIKLPDPSLKEYLPLPFRIASKFVK